MTETALDEPLRCYRHPDRETRVSCSECGRGVCPDCMVFAPVGIRCLDHATQGSARRPQVARRVQHQRRAAAGDPTLVTKILIGLLVGVFLVNLAQGASLSTNGGPLFERWLLFGPFVAQGEWWRLITAAFLHAGLIHLAFNSMFLWIVGAPMEAAIGRVRFLALFFVSGLAGSAGALVFSPTAPTVGASGALFGILGAAIVFERQGFHVLGGAALPTALINLAITFAIPGISKGGHVGGLVGGLLCGLALSQFGRGHAAYGRLGALGFASMAAVGAASVVVSYLKVRGYA